MNFIYLNLIKLIKTIGVLMLLNSCGASTGNTPAQTDRDEEYRTQQLSGTDSEDDEEDFSEDEGAPKPQIISGMYLADIYLSCTADGSIEPPSNQMVVGCLAINEDSGDTFDINEDDNVSYTVKSGSSIGNPEGSSVILRSEDEKDNYEKRYWAFTAITPLGQQSIDVNFVNPQVRQVTVEVEIEEDLNRDIRNAWKNEGLVIPKNFVRIETTQKALHSGK